jgi:hypothetical protein
VARSRIVVVEGQDYLVPRKKYKEARKNFSRPEEAWAYIMQNIEDFGRLLESETEEEQAEVKAPAKKESDKKKESRAKKESDKKKESRAKKESDKKKETKVKSPRRRKQKSA